MAAECLAAQYLVERGYVSAILPQRNAAITRRSGTAKCADYRMSVAAGGRRLVRNRVRLGYVVVQLRGPGVECLEARMHVLTRTQIGIGQLARRQPGKGRRIAAAPPFPD